MVFCAFFMYHKFSLIENVAEMKEYRNATKTQRKLQVYRINRKKNNHQKSNCQASLWRERVYWIIYEIRDTQAYLQYGVHVILNLHDFYLSQGKLFNFNTGLHFTLTRSGILQYLGLEYLYIHIFSELSKCSKHEFFGKLDFKFYKIPTLSMSCI